MATNVFTSDEKKMVKKVQLAWKKWNDSAVGEAEKGTIKATIDKILTRNGWSMDWTNGNVTKGKQAEQPKQEAKKESASTGQRKGMTTADLIKFIFETYRDEWTGKNLRRKIRQMERWNDGKMTHYDFTPQEVNEILTHLGYKKQAS